MDLERSVEFLVERATRRRGPFQCIIDLGAILDSHVRMRRIIDALPPTTSAARRISRRAARTSPCRPRTGIS